MLQAVKAALESYRHAIKGYGGQTSDIGELVDGCKPSGVTKCIRSRRHGHRSGRLCHSPDSDWMDIGMKGSANSSTGCLRLLRDFVLLLLRMQLSSTSLKLAPRDARICG